MTRPAPYLRSEYMDMMAKSLTHHQIDWDQPVDIRDPLVQELARTARALDAIMVDKQLWNNQALYGLQWDTDDQHVAHYINASGRTLYTGDVVVLAQQGNSILGPVVVGGSNVVNLTNTTTTSQALVPAVGLTTTANNQLVIGVVGVRDAGYVDAFSFGAISQTGASSIGGTNIDNRGQLLAGQLCQLAEIGAFPRGSIVPVIKSGIARVHEGGQVSASTPIAQNDLLTTVVGALGNPMALKTATIGNLLGLALETSTWSAANLQTGDADVATLTSAAPLPVGVGIAGTTAGLTVLASATAASATTLLTATDPRSAANDGPSNKATTGIFPNTGVINFLDGTVSRTAMYSAIGATGFTVSATTIVTSVAANAVITFVQSTIRALLKRG